MVRNTKISVTFLCLEQQNECNENMQLIMFTDILQTIRVCTMHIPWICIRKNALNWNSFCTETNKNIQMDTTEMIWTSRTSYRQRRWAQFNLFLLFSMRKEWYKYKSRKYWIFIAFCWLQYSDSNLYLQNEVLGEKCIELFWVFFSL